MLLVLSTRELSLCIYPDGTLCICYDNKTSHARPSTRISKLVRYLELYYNGIDVDLRRPIPRDFDRLSTCPEPISCQGRNEGQHTRGQRYYII